MSSPSRALANVLLPDDLLLAQIVKIPQLKTIVDTRLSWDFCIRTVGRRKIAGHAAIYRLDCLDWDTARYAEFQLLLLHRHAQPTR